jgi:hypothetical protein
VELVSGAHEVALASLAVEHWRLIRSLERLVDLLPHSAQPRVLAQARYATSRLGVLLGDAGMSLETFEGRIFDATLPVTAVNASDFQQHQPLVVSQTIEPSVLCKGRVVLLGKVHLAEEATNVSRN